MRNLDALDVEELERDEGGDDAGAGDAQRHSGAVEHDDEDADAVDWDGGEDSYCTGRRGDIQFKT